MQGNTRSHLEYGSQVCNAHELKRAVGFKSIAGICNEFDHCQAYDIRLDGEENATARTFAYAAGFLFGGTTTVPVPGLSEQKDLHGLVNHCLTRCNFGGAGLAAGVLLYDTQCAVVFDTEMSANDANSFGNAYGLLDVATGSIFPSLSIGFSDSIILRNLAFNNKTLNYLVKFSGVGQNLPVSAATFGNVQGLYCANGWDNVLFEKAPGKEQDARKCKRIFSKLISCPC